MPNFNAGIVKLECFINSYCPFEKVPYSDIGIVFNDETIKSLPDEKLSDISYVKGQIGVGLKEQPNNYHSQYLYIEDESICEDFRKLAKTPKKEDDHFSWKITDHVFLGPLTILKRSEYLEKGNNETSDPQRWDCRRVQASYAKDNTGPKDSTVVMPVQGSASASENVGIHWRVEKKEALYRGEDFFVEFRRVSISTDLKNVTSSEGFSETFLDKKLGKDECALLYPSIDSAERKRNGDPPAFNSGVVSYEPTINQNNSITYKAIDASREIYDFSNQVYFIIEMGVGLKYRYFIIITQKGYPRFIKCLKDSKYKTGRYNSYVVGEYQSKIGNDLIQGDSLRIDVKNYLGKLVILFNNDSSDPWIIEDIPTKEQKSSGSSSAPGSASSGSSSNSGGVNIPVYNNYNSSGNPTSSEGDDLSFLDGQTGGETSQGSANNSGPGPLFCVPAAPIAIWSGNTPVGFLFSPIVYIEKTTMQFPLPSKSVSDKEKVKTPAFALPLGNNKILLSQRDLGLHSSATPRNPAAFSTSGDLKQTTRKPFYTCDCQIVEEVNAGGTFDPYFMDYGDYLKEIVKDKESKLIVKKTKVSSPPEEDSIDSFTATLEMKSGSHLFKNGWELKNCKTPIVTIMRLISNPTNNSAWTATPIDATPITMSYNETWSAQDYSRMEHNGSIRFLINKGMTGLSDLARRVENLKDKAFYIKVNAGYKECNYTNLDGMYRMITGICYGGTISESAGQRIMECKIYDYTKILEHSIYFNYPFYDGVRDVNAIYELGKMAKFKDYYASGNNESARTGTPQDRMGEEDPPMFLMKQIISATVGKDEYGCMDGLQGKDRRKISKSKVYALPHGYDILQGGAQFKFKDGDNLITSMDIINKRSGKVMFFDSYGMLHYEAFPLASLVFSNDNPNAIGIPISWKFSVSPLKDGSILIHNQLNKELAVEDVYNEILIMTSSPKQGLIFADDVNTKSTNDPSSEGFLGYKKIMFQADGIFGSQEAASSVIQHYKKFYRPPVVFKIETFGVPMRCFDVLEIDRQKVIAINISQNIDAKENKWWMNVEGEWLHGYTEQSET